MTSGPVLGVPSLTLGWVYAPSEVEIVMSGSGIAWGGKPNAVPSEGLLDAFLRIEASAERAADFVSRFGALGLCMPHGLPFGHDEARSPFEEPLWAYFGAGAPHLEPRTGPSECWLQRDRKGRHVEGVGQLALLSLKARALLDEFASVRLGKSISAEAEGLWLTVAKKPENDDETMKPRLQELPLPAQKLVLVHRLNEWARWSMLQPSLTWEQDADGPVFALQVSTFGSLVAQMMTLAAGAAGWAVCSNCRLPYQTVRKPQAGFDNFCQQSECLKARARLGKQRQRAGTAKRRGAAEKQRSQRNAPK